MKKKQKHPCFQINSITSIDTQTAAEYELNTFAFEIVYFAEENNKGSRELLKTKRILKAVLINL